MQNTKTYLYYFAYMDEEGIENVDICGNRIGGLDGELSQTID